MTGTDLEIPEVVGISNLLDLSGLLPFVDGDGQLLDLVFEPALPRRDFHCHALEKPGEITKGVGPLSNLVETLRGEGARLDGERRRRDPGDAPQICEIEVAGTLLRQAAANADAEHHGIEGFGEIVVGAECKTSRDALRAIHRGDDQDRNLSRRLIALQPGEDLVTAGTRQPDVE